MKRLPFFLATTLIVVTTTLFSQPQLEKANELMKQNKVNEAITAYQSYLQSNPRDENAWLLLSKAYHQIKNLDSAEDAAKKAVDLDDEMLEGYALLGQVQLAKHNWIDAYKTANAGLKTIKKTKPKYPPLLVVLGQSLIGLDSADAALVAATQATVLEPQNATAYEVIGDAYAKQGVIPMSVSSYEKSLEINPEQSQVLLKLAKTYTKDRQYTDAAKVYSRILNIEPNNEPARLELGELFFRAKQFQKCVEVLIVYFKSHKNPPTDVQSMYLEALFRSGHYKEAFQMAQDLIKLEPNSPLATRAIAYGYINNKQYPQAIEIFKKLSTIDSLEFDDYRWMGAAYKQTKKDTLAASAWQEALKDTTQLVKVRSYLLGEVGAIWMNLKFYERAAEFLHERMLIDTEAVAAYINYALCMMQLERYESAVSVLKKAIAQNDKYPGAYVNLGFCYFQMKEYDASEKEFRSVIKIIDTAETKYRFELADSYRMIGYLIMLQKKLTPEESQKKWEDAITVLKKSVKFKEDVAQTHQLLGQCYHNLYKKEDAIREYKRTQKLDPKNEVAKKGLQALQLD